MDCGGTLVPRVLVIAPHPDDDTIGCGGTLARLAGRGSRIDVTYVTDGSRSHTSRRFSREMLRDLREDEARMALARLGIPVEPQFMRAPDGSLGDLEDFERGWIVDELAQRIASTRADIVFAPWLRDPHPDHVATAWLVDAALATAATRPRLLWYTVWLPVRGDTGDIVRHDEAVSLAISLNASELERKRDAIMAHRSQTTNLIDDDPHGFRIDARMLATWLAPSERFYSQRPT